MCCFKKIVFLGVFWLLTLCSSFASEPYYKNYNSDNSTFSLMNFCLAQDDAKGYLWVGGSYGLRYYNGYEFGRIHELTGKAVLQLYPQPNGQIWGVTVEKKLFYITPDNFQLKFYPFNYIIEEYPEKEVINSLYIDNENTLYLGFVGNGMIRIDSLGIKSDYFSDRKSGSSTVLNAIEMDNAENYRGFTIGADDPNELKKLMPGFSFVEINSSSNGMFRSVRNAEKTVFLTPEAISIKGDDFFWRKKITSKPIGIGEFDENHFWVSTLKMGLQIYTYNGQLKRTLLPDKSITDVLIDHEKGVWAATLISGVYYIGNPNVTEKIDHTTANKRAAQLAKGKAGELYISYDDGTVSSYLEGVYSNLKIPLSPHNAPRMVYHKKFGLVTANENIVQFYGESTIPDTSKVNCFITALSDDDSENELLVGCITGFAIMDSNKEITYFETGLRSWDLIYAPNGIYCATQAGLYLYSDEGEFIEMAERDSLFSAPVNDIDRMGEYYYLATTGLGLVVFNEDTVFNLTKKDGYLYNNYILNLNFQNDSTLWTSSSIGINRIIISRNGTNEISGFSMEDGLLSNFVFDIQIYNDSVWAPTRNGLCVFPIEIIDSLSVSERKLAIKEITINDRPIEVEHLSNLKHDENRLNVDFEAISFRNNYFLRYRYRLDGLEDRWNYTEGHKAIYSLLLPGEYRFVVQVSGNNRDWEENEISFPVVIQPPYYDTWWFKIIAFVSVLLLIYFFFKIRILTYNRDITRELLRIILQKFQRNEKSLVIKEQGNSIKIATNDIYYIKSTGNYVEIVTANEKHLFRCKIGKFMELLPDQLEFLRVHRSYIIRLDKIKRKNRKALFVNNTEIPIGKSYQADLLKVSI